MGFEKEQVEEALKITKVKQEAIDFILSKA